MATTTPTKSISKSQTRSISLPCKSHPTTLKIEEELKNLQETWEAAVAAMASAETISNGLCGLVELYNSMDELLNMPQTLQALFKHQNEKWVDELSENPVKLLDICGITRDVISQANQHVIDLQSSLRRRKGDLSDIEASIVKYTSFRKKMKKDAKTLIASLKQMDQTIEASSVLLEVDQQVSAVIRVLREVNALSVCIFQGFFSFLLASRPSRWASISRLVLQKGTTACDDQLEYVNELESVDNALRGICRDEKIQFVQKKLKNLETCFEIIESGLEGVFRCLIRSRTSLLNMVTC